MNELNPVALEKAQAAVKAWNDWMEADGWDNAEYDYMLRAMSDLAEEVGNGQPEDGE